jgi:hypothetical protein
LTDKPEPKKAGSDPIPIATIAEAVAQIGPTALKAIDSLKGAIGDRSKVDEAAKKADKAADDIRDGIKQAKAMANVLKTYRELNEKANDLKTNITSLQLSILRSGAREVDDDIKGKLSDLSEQFEKLKEFSFDDLIDESRIEVTRDQVTTIGNNLAGASASKDIAEVKKFLTDISRVLSSLLAKTFYASKKVEDKFAAIGV